MATKLDLKWLPGYRIIKMESARLAIISKDGSAIQEKVNVRLLKKVSPVSELLSLASDVPKIYFRLDDLPDLNWPAIDVPFPDKEEQKRAQELARANPPGLRTKTSRRDVEPRTRKKPKHLQDYV